jgi:hypothetical protein
MTQPISTLDPVVIKAIATLSYVEAQNVLKDHPAENWVTTFDMASGLSVSGKRERFVLDLMDADLLTVQTAAELVYHGTHLEQGEDRAAIAAVISLCYWASGDDLLGKTWAMVGAAEGSRLAELIAESLDKGITFDILVPPMFHAVRDMIEAEHTAPVLSTTGK